MNFWQNLPRPFTVLAPMDGVTDTVFRQIVASAARPDVFFTEFASVEGLSSRGHDGVAKKLRYSEAERPIVAQIWGKDPEKYRQIATMVADMGFDGVDINMGCPERSIVKGGSCGGLIQTPTLAAEIIAAVREGCRGLPLCVKTRIGFNTIKTEEWCGWLLQQKLDVLTVHGRTVKEMSAVPAHWDEIARVVALRDAGGHETLIIGNGDVKNAKEARDKSEQYGVDGVMIGRGIFENLWCFGDKVGSKEEQLMALNHHLQLWEETWGDSHNFVALRKFLKMYIRGWDGASQVRDELMRCATLVDLKRALYILF